ncbi:MAG: hypothetical protein ACI84O_001438 [Myxococcota bacterium]|jgi:uncharacterized protein YbaR (Trm112 family)
MISTIPESLLKLLRCPISRQPLTVQDQRLVAHDGNKTYIYPIRDGFAVLLAEEATITEGSR